MTETRLLIFRCGGEEYGVYIENVTGVIGGAEEQAVGKAIPAMDTCTAFNNRDNKPVIIMNSSGVQIALLVDEVLTVMRLAQENEAAGGSTIADFKIWQLGDGIRGDLEVWNPLPSRLRKPVL
jgi:chemotaxis signal transduction protein